MKLVAWLLIAIAVCMWANYIKRQRLKENQAGRPRARSPFIEPSNPAALQPEQFVSCLHCGLHVPVSEAVQTGIDNSGVSVSYCSEEHRRLHSRS